MKSYCTVLHRTTSYDIVRQSNDSHTMTYDFTMIAWWEANIVLYIKVARWSYDDRMTVVRCRTIIDWVLRRRTIIFEVVWRHRTSIAQISCDDPRRRTIDKVFTKILNSRMMSWAAARNKIDNSQGAYQKDKSTIDHIFTLMAIVQKYLSKAGGRFYCAFIDFSKCVTN